MYQLSVDARSITHAHPYPNLGRYPCTLVHIILVSCQTGDWRVAIPAKCRACLFSRPFDPLKSTNSAGQFKLISTDLQHRGHQSTPTRSNFQKLRGVPSASVPIAIPPSLVRARIISCTPDFLIPESWVRSLRQETTSYFPGVVIRHVFGVRFSRDQRAAR
jgi:hypothetical protein